MTPPPDLQSIAETLAPLVAEAIATQINQLRGEVHDAIMQLHSRVDHIELAVAQLNVAQTDGLWGQEVQSAYRGFVVAEAARLGVKAVEVKRAGDVVDPS